jgi:hypothetical protein
MDWLKSEGADIFSEQTGIDLGQFGLGSTFDAANALGGGAAERAQDLYGLGTNADLGGAEFAQHFGEQAGTTATGATGAGASTVGTTLSGTGADGVPGTLSESWQGMQNTFDASQLSAGASAAGAVGGFAGSYLGSKIPGLGTDTPLGGYMGGVAGTAIGAGAIGGAGAAMAAAGPAAIVGAAIIIGQGIYGVVKGAKDRDHQRDEYRRVTGEATHGQKQVDDPTGIGEGKGAMYTSGGHTFFLPEKYYANLKKKNMQGEYGHMTEFNAPQGSYGYWQDPATQEWHFGSFGGQGFGAKAMDVGSFRFQDREAAYAKRQAAIDKYLNDREADQWYASQTQGLSGEGEVKQLEKITNQYRAKKGLDPAYKQVMSGGEGGQESHWVSTAPERQNNCFVGETLVRMANGVLVPIEDIEVGDYVDAGGRVTGITHHPSSATLYDPGHVKGKGWVTWDHPFWVDGEWVKASQLEGGESAEKGEVYTLHVTNGDHYFAGPDADNIFKVKDYI